MVVKKHFALSLFVSILLLPGLVLAQSSVLCWDVDGVMDTRGDRALEQSSTSLAIIPLHNCGHGPGGMAGDEYTMHNCDGTRNTITLPNAAGTATFTLTELQFRPHERLQGVYTNIIAEVTREATLSTANISVNSKGSALIDGASVVSPYNSIVLRSGSLKPETTELANGVTLLTEARQFTCRFQI